MDVRTQKLSIIQQLLEVDDILLLDVIKNILDYGLKDGDKKDFWDELTEEQKATIELSRQQHKEGKNISHQEMMKALRKKYSA